MRDSDDSVLAELEHLRGVAAERARFLEMTTTALNRVRAEADRREALIHELTQALAQRDEVIANLRRVVDERLDTINILDESARGLREDFERRMLLVADLTALIEEKDREIARLRGQPS